MATADTARLLAAETKLLTEQRHTAALRNELSASTQRRSEHRLLRTAARSSATWPSCTHASKRRSDRPTSSWYADIEDYLDLLVAPTRRRPSTHRYRRGPRRIRRNAGRTRIPARGVDISVDAVEEAQRHGRPVELAEANAYLSTLESESIGAVTAFHVIEHLEPEVVLRLLDESLRVLRAGRHTDHRDAESDEPQVGAAAFYHDPTHLRPGDSDVSRVLGRRSRFHRRRDAILASATRVLARAWARTANMPKRRECCSTTFGGRSRVPRTTPCIARRAAPT